MKWEYINFLEAVNDITGGNRKFQSSEYLSVGRYPIVDQSDLFIGGYTNEGDVVRRNSPVVVFGDHTKCLKYVEFDFCLGADGVKILEPKAATLDAKFLYYYLMTINLPDVGYSRHYKFLKEIQIPLPPLPIQKRIAEILDAADALRKKDQELLKKYDELAQAIFIDMFGDPVRNEKGWDVKKLGDALSNIQIGPFGTQLHESDYVHGGIPVVNPMHIKNLKIHPNPKYSIGIEKYNSLKEYHLHEGDVVLGRRGEMGRCALVNGEEHLICGTGSLFMTTRKSTLNPLFLTYLLSQKSTVIALENCSAGTTMPNLNKGIINDFPVILPPIRLQNDFEKSILGCQKSLSIAWDEIVSSNKLFEIIINMAFSGELVS